MRIAIGCDHGGLNLKNEIIEHLNAKGIEVVDYGTKTTESTNYAIYSEKVAEVVTNKEFDFGILVCGTGQGIGLAANKVSGIRAVTVSDVFSAEMTRAHNNANILCLGERVLGFGLALKIVDTFLETKFEGGRHATRVDLITEIEQKYSK